MRKSKQTSFKTGDYTITSLGTVTGATTSGLLPYLCDFGVVDPFLYFI